MTQDYDTWLRWIDGTIPWQERYPDIAEHVREVVRQSGPLDSTSLVKRMLAHLTKDQRDALTKRVHDILKPISKHDLKDWWSLSSKLKRGYAGRLTAPRIWRAPESEPERSAPSRSTPDNGKLWQHMGVWERANIRALAQSPLERNSLFTKFMALVYEIEEGHAPDWAPEGVNDLSDYLL